MILNKKGSITLVAMFFCTLISALLLASYKSIIRIEKQIITKTKHYLCVKEVVTVHKNLVDSVETINKLIISANLMKMNPETYSLAVSLIETYKISQNVSLAKAIAKITSSTFCSSLKKPFLISELPYGMKFSRNFADLAQLKEKKWIFTYKNLDLKNPYITKIHMRARGNGSTEVNSKIKEYSKKDLAISNLFSGLEY